MEHSLSSCPMQHLGPTSTCFEILRGRQARQSCLQSICKGGQLSRRGKQSSFSFPAATGGPADSSCVTRAACWQIKYSSCTGTLVHGGFGIVLVQSSNLPWSPNFGVVGDLKLCLPTTVTTRAAVCPQNHLGLSKLLEKPDKSCGFWLYEGFAVHPARFENLISFLRHSFLLY